MSSFLRPELLWWLAALLPAILVLYFLKLRRSNRVVSSTLLWRRSVYDLQVNAPVQMIRRSLLLFVQIAIALLIIFALARPFVRGLRKGGRRAAIILDVSASMNTRDAENGITRLDAAKAEARRLVEAMAARPANEGADEYAVIAAGDRPHLLCGLTAERPRLLAAINGAESLHCRTDMAAAVEMAIAVTGVDREARVLEQGGTIQREAKPEGEEEEFEGVTREVALANVTILSDGAFPGLPARLAERLSGPAEGSDDPGAGSRFVAFGRAEVENAGIVALDLRANPLRPAERQLFVRVENAGEGAVRRELALRLDGEFVDRKEVTIPGRGESGATGQTGVVFEVPEAAGVLEARLTPGDALSDDDAAWAVLSPTRPVRALLVSEGNYFLQNALTAAQGQIVYDRLSPGDWPADGALPRNDEGMLYEVIVFDRWSPPALPSGAGLYVDAQPPDAGVAVEADGGFLYVPMVVDWDRVHAFTSGLTLLDRLEISRSRNWSFAAGWKTVMEGQGWVLADPADMADEAKAAAAPERSAPLLACRVDEERRIGVVAFNPTDSQWPMRVSFPLFVRNAVLWLARPGGLRRAEALRSGDTLQMDTETPVAAAKVVSPGGREFPAFVAASGRSVSFSDTYELGAYRMTAGDRAAETFAVGLLATDETDNRMRSRMDVGGRDLAASAQAERNADVWPWLAAAALALLVLEWMIYNRRLLG